jgi:hypothetical protein
MWLKTIILSFVTVLAFFALVIALGWLDTDGQSYYEILRNVFAGSYLFFTVPVFILSFFLLHGHGGFRMLLMRMLTALLVSLGAYVAIAKYLISKLNG